MRLSPATSARYSAGRLADAVIADPPYGACYDGEAGTIENDNLPSDGFLSFRARAFPSAGTPTFTYKRRSSLPHTRKTTWS